MHALEQNLEQIFILFLFIILEKNWYEQIVTNLLLQLYQN